MLLRKYLSHTKTDNGYIIHGDSAGEGWYMTVGCRLRHCQSEHASFAQVSREGFDLIGG
ncbi:MAG: hypothetical protein IJS28_09820 [Synergistaceae bacterium]|nr:hypothetical protein [Synergistaceae bacterium]